MLIAIRDSIPYKRIVDNESPDWSEKLEIVAVEIEMKSSRKILVSVCYRKPSCDPKEWLKFFTSFLETCSTYDKVLVTGDLNFPDLTWNSCLVPNTTQRNISVGSFEFRELTFDFFLSKVNMHPTRISSILDLVLSTTPEDVVNLSCLEPSQ